MTFRYKSSVIPGYSTRHPHSFFSSSPIRRTARKRTTVRGNLKRPSLTLVTPAPEPGSIAKLARNQICRRLSACENGYRAMRRSDPASRVKPGMTGFVLAEIKFSLRIFLVKLRHCNTFNPFTISPRTAVRPRAAHLVAVRRIGRADVSVLKRRRDVNSCQLILQT